MAAPDVTIVSRRLVRPSPRPKDAGAAAIGSLIHLNPWDLRMLSIHYIQKGLLFPKPKQPPTTVVSHLYSSFSQTLDHFFPLAGRLATAKHDTGPASLSISIDCNDAGAEFVQASAAAATASDILDPLYVPPIVHLLFPLNGAIGTDGHALPLLAVQVTELADGAVFIACSLNHAVADGTTFWRFINCWSKHARTGGLDHFVDDPPVLQRWFPESCTPPIRLPFSDLGEFISRPTFTSVKERFFHFSAASIAKLKKKANEEMGTDRVSSLQALLAHVWRAVTRARGLEPHRETTYAMLVGTRTRITPSLPQAYLGNALSWVSATATAGEVLERGLGWSAWLLNRVVAAEDEETIRDAAKKWVESPAFVYTDRFQPANLGTSSSPRFDMFGNDFGWGRPVAVRSGPGNKKDGKMTVYPVPEQDGGISLEACLSPQVVTAMADDEEFMAAVNDAVAI